jgi:hypothetical protein
MSSTNYRVVNSYFSILPEKNTFKVGDIVYFFIMAPFETVNQRNGEKINIKRTKDIYEFWINAAKVDSITRPPGGFDGGFDYMDVSPVAAKRFRIDTQNGIKGNIYVSFAKLSQSFEVKLRVILRKKGVFMIEHGPTSGYDAGCMLTDFAPALNTVSQNEELFRAFSFNTNFTLRPTQYFFKVE